MRAQFSLRGHIKVFGFGGAVIFSSIFNKYGIKKALGIFAEGVKAAKATAAAAPRA